MKTVRTITKLREHNFNEPFRLSFNIPYPKLGQMLGYIADVLNFETIWDLVVAHYPDYDHSSEIGENDLLYRVLFEPENISPEDAECFSDWKPSEIVEKYRHSTIEIVNESLIQYFKN